MKEFVYEDVVEDITIKGDTHCIYIINYLREANFDGENKQMRSIYIGQAKRISYRINNHLKTRYKNNIMFDDIEWGYLYVPHPNESPSLVEESLIN